MPHGADQESSCRGDGLKTLPISETATANRPGLWTLTDPFLDHCPNYIFKLMEQGRRMFDVSIGSSSAQCPASVVSNEAAKLIVNANLQHGCVFRNV